jgi:hypothetical protein
MFNDFTRLLGSSNWIAAFSCAAGAYGFHSWRWQALLACCCAIGLTVGMFITLEPQTARE